MNTDSLHTQPLLIVVGGFAGTGKSVMSRRLSRELCMPRLGSDTIGRTIKNLAEIQGLDVNAYSVGYQVLFRLCEEFVQSGVSAIVDITLGWEQQWCNLDRIIERNPCTVFLPVILRCSREDCMVRIARRHQAKPEYYDPPDVYTSPNALNVWRFLGELHRPEVHFVDAARTQDEVYDDIRLYIGRHLEKSTISARSRTK